MRYPKQYEHLRKSGGRKLLAMPPFTECVDQSFGCAYWKSKGYCHHYLYKMYMHANCEVSCGTCACQVTAPPPPNMPVSTPMCAMCCSKTTTCEAKWPALKGGRNVIQCVSDPPVSPEGWPLDYNMRYIGGMGFNPSYHPYWQILHGNIAYWREKNHANSFPVPRRAHTMVAEGRGRHARFWMFGGFGTVPSAGGPVDVWENIGTCTSIGIGKRETCDGKPSEQAQPRPCVNLLMRLTLTTQQFLIRLGSAPS